MIAYRPLAATVMALFLITGSARAAAEDAPPPPSPEARDDAAWSAYHQAFRALLSGDRAGGVAALGRIEAAYPGHPAAQHAATLLRVVRAREEPRPDADATAEEEAGRGERPTRGARAELIVFQTLHGVAVGAELCASLACQGARPHALALMAGGGVGLGLSLLGSARGVTPGQVELLDTGTLWGAWNGFEASLIAGENTGSARFWRTMMIGQGGGLLLGGLLWFPLRPTSGQVALASTVGAWSTVATAFGVAALDLHGSDRQLWTTLLVAGDAGLVVGAVAARGSTISRGRTLLVDAGGVLGLLVGALIATGSNSSQTKATAGLIGTGLGLAVSGYATRDWDVPVTNARLAVAPAPGGGAVAGLGGTF
jgi:hypothetical protein